MEKDCLSKSEYCRAKQCNKILWLDKNKPEYAEAIANDSVLENGSEVGKLAKGLLGEHVDILYQENINNMIEETKKYMSLAPNIITEASFCYHNNFCSIDLLKNDIDGVEVYEIKSSTRIADIYLEDIAYQIYILLHLGYNVKKVNLTYINSNYERKGDLELNKLLKTEDVTQQVMKKQKEVERKIQEIEEYMKNEAEPIQEIGTHCSNPYSCAYWKYCTKELPEKNVFHIRRMPTHKKFEMYYNGIITFPDLLKEAINPRYKEQIEYEITNKESKIEKKKINEFLKGLHYPLYFLDFETYQQVIPKYDGIKPYMQIPFQYSLHYIEEENGKLQHKEFLAEAGYDPRRKLAERLIQDIPKDVCVLAYNMGFERGVIKNLAKEFPDLSQDLMKIHMNIQDLMIPFSKRWYYCKEMEGSYSIKHVLPALFPNEPELDYHNLPLVHNGGEAMSTFATLAEKSKEEQEEIRRGLLAYCKLDTLAMVKIWEKLREVING
ncbi:MAG: DUF2779 domain-containing protein [Clostridia bacterium]|jgi:hypothetical protein|nr:DUF2779 domain-containing protein [Clostridia bacterium]MCI9413262.1 DUF2779 domain-containing protein [Clostridia bacterium]